MNALAKEGFVILGGPLDGTSDVLLVMRAESPDDVRSRLAQDPWAGNDLLRITRAAPWTLRLGSLFVGRLVPELVDKAEAVGELKDLSFIAEPLK